MPCRSAEGRLLLPRHRRRFRAGRSLLRGRRGHRRMMSGTLASARPVPGAPLCKAVAARAVPDVAEGPLGGKATGLG